MASVNKVLLMGRVVADPELKITPTGKNVVTFRLAVDRKYSQEACDFFDIVAWDKTAEFVCKYFAKGRGMVVVGQLRQRVWTDNATKKQRSAVEVLAEEIDFDGYPKSIPATQEQRDAYTAAVAETAAKMPTAAKFEEVTGDDGLPF